MSEKSRGRLLLPEIPTGVKPAASPLTTRALREMLSDSPSLPRSPNVTREGRSQVSREVVTAMAGIPLSAKDGEDSSVRVAVRVRPFSQREQMMNATCVVSMAGNRTSIASSSGKVHMFTYDHCFWSAGGGAGEGVEDAGQEQVYIDLARPLLDSSFKGYNTCLFAYGQTGSGKSYCIMGEGGELGIVPRFAEELFARVDGTEDSKNTYNVQVSYYEIYNEKVYDLLCAGSTNKDRRGRNKLRVREHQVFGPYVEDLSTYVATSYSDIERWLRMGNRVRATNATSMNERSSRSHAIFSISLTHTTLEVEEEHSTVSRINIIDLAGSERSKVAGTSGDRLKEGASINRSLHTLGKVISLLAEKSSGRRDKVYVPYRDSTLTWILKDSLGGNSKTAMIATISPAHLHYEESLSTLRYAQQARNIVNIARINEDPNIRIIRELTGEIQLLREKLSVQGGEAGLTEIKSLREQLAESEKLRTAMTRSWQEKLRESEQRKREELDQLRRSGLAVNSRLPNLVNLTEDPQLSETLLYMLPVGQTTVGNTSRHMREEGGTSGNHIELSGPLVCQNHCEFVHEDQQVHLQPSPDPQATTYVNGTLLTATTTLHHGDRVVLGGSYFFRFNFPHEVGVAAAVGKSRDYQYARDELFQAQTERIKQESEEKLLKERQELLSQLEELQESKQAEYQLELQRLAKEMEEKSGRLQEEEETKEAAEQRVAELLLRNQALEQETLNQRHIIQLEKLKTEKESKDLELQRNQLMDELEQEKRKLEEDISQLSNKKNIRELSVTDSILAGAVGGASGSDLVQVSVMLQEASAICKALNKPLTFSREERGGASCVRVSNGQNHMVSHWDMNKFETRLDQMRDMYHLQDSTHSLSSTSLASPDSEDPFNDPSDGWTPSPLRSLQRMQTSPGLATPISLVEVLSPSSSISTPVSRQLDFDPKRSARRRQSLRARYSSPHLLEGLHATPSASPTPQSLETWTHNMGAALGQLVHRRPGVATHSWHGDSIKEETEEEEEEEEEVEEEGVFQRMAGYMCKIRTDCCQATKLSDRDIEERDRWCVLLSSITLCVEGLYEACSSLHERCVQEVLMLAHLPQGHTFSASHISYRLLQTLSQHCTKFAVTLNKCDGMEELQESLQSLSLALCDMTELLGQLLLATQLNGSLLYAHLRSSGVEREEEDRQMDSILQYPLIWPWTQEEELRRGVARGVSLWVKQVLDTLSRSLDHTLKAVTRQPLHGKHSPAKMSSVVKLAEAALSFMRFILQVQEEVWSEQEDAVGVPQAVQLLLPLHRLTHSLTRNLRSSHDGWEGLTPVRVCSEMGVAALALTANHGSSREVHLLAQALMKTARNVVLART